MRGCCKNSCTYWSPLHSNTAQAKSITILLCLQKRVDLSKRAVCIDEKSSLSRSDFWWCFDFDTRQIMKRFCLQRVQSRVAVVLTFSFVFWMSWQLPLCKVSWILCNDNINRFCGIYNCGHTPWRWHQVQVRFVEEVVNIVIGLNRILLIKLPVVDVLDVDEGLSRQ